MEFMYCIPDLEVFIDSTIKKCLLEYDLEREDTESVLNDMEKVMVRPMDDDKRCYEKSSRIDNHNTQKNRRVFLDTSRIKDLSSVLGAVQDLQKLKTMDKSKIGKEDVIASLMKDKCRMLDLPGGVLDFSKISASAGLEKNSAEEQEDGSRCPSREYKSSSPDISSSPKLPTKLKSRLQQRYFQNSREPSPELTKDKEDPKPRSPVSPDSGHVTSTGLDCDHSLTPSPTGRDSRKRSASGDSVDDQVRSGLSPLSKGETNGSIGERSFAQEQPRAKIPHLIEYPQSPNSTSSQKPIRQTLKEGDDGLFSLYCLAFRSSSNGSVPIETLNRSMHVPMLLKEKIDTSFAQNKPDQEAELREKHHISKNVRPLSSPVSSASQPTQSHTAQSQKPNNHHQRYQLLRQRLQQRNQNPQELNSALLASQRQHHQQELQKRQQTVNSFYHELAAAEKFLGHTSLISSIIAEELMKVEDKAVPKSIPSSVNDNVNSHDQRIPNGTSASSLDVHTTDARTVPHATPTFTHSSQAPPLIAVTNWPSSPPFVQQPLVTSLQKAVPLRAHQSHVNTSTVCVVPDSSICLKAVPSRPTYHYDDNVPQDLSQKSSRRKAEEA